MFKSPETSRRTALLPAIVILILLAGLVAGCAGPRPRPQPPHIPGYEGLQEDFQGLDLAPLRHRRVVLDPGHGGFFKGAIGPNGLTEAEVNLGVALYLRGLLEWAGAEVWLTRTADTDFLSPADSSLTSDLAMRVSLSDSIQPDVFLSLHHNSNASLDRTINETQTYYPLSDDGASLDLARAIHRHLVLNLEIQPASIRPGNFYVLRNATVPAVLGEPAMISHPVMAGRLSLAASQRLEAEAYFLGLLDYFSGGRPSWSGAATDTVFWGAETDPQQISWEFLPGGSSASEPAPDATALPGPDPGLTRLRLDGAPISSQLSPDARTITWQIPRQLQPVPHLLTLQGRNLAGRATPTRRTVLLPRAAMDLEITITQAGCSDLSALHWRGPGGRPLPTGLLHFGDDLVIPVGPERSSWFLSDRPGSDWQHQAITWQDNAASPVHELSRPRIHQLPPDRDLRLVELQNRPYTPTGGWRPRLGLQASSALITLDAKGPYWLEGSGLLPLLDLNPSEPNQPRTVAAGAATWQAVPILPDLLGKVIVLDPAGGDTDTDGAGPLGLRGADLNLAVAEQAAILLRGAGAEVHLTRHDETALPPVEKVRLSGQLHADLFLTIGRHAVGAPREVRHHPGSTVGRQWALAAVQASAQLPRLNPGVADTCLIAESSGYLLRHTACPALEWRLDPPGTVAQEMRQIQPTWHRAEARAILLAITAISGYPDVFANQFHPAELWPAMVPAGGFAPEEIDWVLVDGNLPWSPLPGVQPVEPLLQSVASENGPGLPALLPRHLLEIHAAERWQLWLVTRDQTHWEPTLLLGNTLPSTPTVQN